MIYIDNRTLEFSNPVQQNRWGSRARDFSHISYILYTPKHIGEELLKILFVFLRRGWLGKTHIGQLRVSGGGTDQNRRRKIGVVVKLDYEKLIDRIQPQ